MQLSEAIRLGAMLKPQGHGADSLFGQHTCALGAASDALGFEESDERYGYLMERFTYLHASQTCPVCDRCYEYDGIASIVWHLNDAHEWTREQIADLVETLEPPAGPVSEDTPTPVSARCD